MSTVCLDASLVLDWLIPTSRSPGVDALWDNWVQKQVEFIGPPLLLAETTSVLWEWVYRGALSRAFGEAAYAHFCNVDIRIVTHPDLHIRAWQFAFEFNHPRAYDAQYLAVAEREECEFWTTDRRLYNSVHSTLPWVRLVQP